MLDRVLRGKAPPRPNEPSRDAALLERILAYDPDKPGVAMPFSKRLAHENGWTRDYARRVVDEYKRFVYLACISDHEVTPSDEIDQAWHLHLAYSRDYWLEFCAKVLERPLHHDPAEGTTSDEARFKFNYERTLSLYKEVFDAAPPPAIWPPAAIRFRYGADQKRVNLAIFDISPKKTSADRGARIIAPIMIGLMAVMLSAATIPFKPVWDTGSVLWASAGTFGIAYALWRLLGHFVVNVLKSKSPSFAGQNPVSRKEHGHSVTFTAHSGAIVGGYAWLPDIAIEVGSNGVGISSGGCGTGGGGDGGGGSC